MKNYKPILLDANWIDVEKMVFDAAQEITYQSYNGGNSIDTCRKSIPFECMVLDSVMLGALQAIKRRDDSAQAALDTAEFTIEYLLLGINGYDSVYLPICRILEKLDAEKDAATAGNHTSDCDSHVPWSERVYHAYLENGGGETQFGS